MRRTISLETCATHVLVVSIAHPRERAEDTNGHREVGDNTHNQDGVVVVLVVNED